MNSLLSIEMAKIEVPHIPGLTYLPDYIEEHEEQELSAAVDSLAWNTDWQRRRQLYGKSYGGTEDEPRPIPDWGLQLANRMLEDGITHRPFDHMLVNEYLPGQGIALHRDYETFDDTIVSLSLLWSCVMDFRLPACDYRESFLLEPRSLLILSGDARHQWQHGIAGRKKDFWQHAKLTRNRRVSITFRSTK